MRIFIILLIVANILYGLLNYFVIEPNRRINGAGGSQQHGGGSLVLLSEFEKEHLNELKELPAISSFPSSSKQLVACMKVVGDWDINTLDSVKQRLSDKDKLVISEGKERRKKVNYWVVIPPFASKQEAITAKHQLQNEKIMDTFIIKSGIRENALSLGLYSKHDGAIRRAEFVNSKRLGISIASIEELTLYVDRYWIKVATTDDETESINEIINEGILDTKVELCEIER